MKSKRIWIAAAIPVLAVLWYLFRPELLFVKKQVNEEFPGTSAPTAVSGESAPLATGRFHSVAHDTMGEASIHELEGGRRALANNRACAPGARAGPASFRCEVPRAEPGRTS